MITALPLYHVYALTSNCLCFMPFGGTNLLITNPRDMVGFVKELAKYRFTAITGVNTLFNALLHTPGFDKLDFSALKLGFGVIFYDGFMRFCVVTQLESTCMIPRNRCVCLTSIS